MSRTLYFGGSFNPIHVGHVRCALAAADAGGFGRVVLVPSARPPHKPGQTDLASPDDRLAMCRLAAAGDPGHFGVNDLELRRIGPSYTLDTARQLQAATGERVAWLIGADSLLSLPTWHRPLQLLREVDFVVMARPGWTLDWMSLSEPYRALERNVVTTPLVDVSATAIRRRVAAGEPIDGLVLPSVARYIREKGLYRRDGK